MILIDTCCLKQACRFESRDLYLYLGVVSPMVRDKSRGLDSLSFVQRANNVRVLGPRDTGKNVNPDQHREAKEY